MKQLYIRKPIARLLTLALLLVGFGSIDRVYAATITVTTFADNLTDLGDCSLREAIQAANTNTAVDACAAGSGADTISLTAGTYSLSRPNVSGDEDANQTGDLDILSNLTIKGVDASTTNITTTVALDRVMQILPGSTVTLNGLSISNGHSSENGGAINNSGTLTLNDVVIKKSIADGNGGGIFNSAGTVIISESTINNNQAHHGGGIYNNSGTVTLNACTVNDNGTTGGGDGGGVYNKANLIVNGCWIHDNQAVAGDGAGIYNTSTATITGSTIAANYATDDGNGGGNGGNIFSGDAGVISALTMRNSAVIDGFAYGNGGGIYNDGALSLTNITITTNKANLGDGIYNTEATQPMSLTNTTVVSNTVSPVGSGEGIHNASSAPIMLKNTLVAYNGTLGDCAGPISSAGHNLEYNLAPNGNTCSLTATGDLTGTAPMLGSFQNNGGKTYTYALLLGSPAINAGTNAGCPATDQRGVTRPRGPSCDIGAYEANQQPVALADSYATNEDTVLVVGQPGVLSNDTDPDSDAITASLVSQPLHGVLTLNPNGSFSYTPDANYHGPDSFSYRASDGALSSPGTVVSLTVHSVNDAPIALANTYSTDRDTPLIISQPGVLGNDTDADTDPLTAILVSGPAHGVLSLNANGSFSYTPSPVYTGPDSFSYRAGDGASLSATAHVALTVQGQNSAPLAGSDAASTSIDTLVMIPISKLLINDSDPDGDPLNISDVRGNSARGGQVTLTDGNVVYTPPAQFVGVDSLIYTLNDGHGGTSSGTVAVTVGMRQLYLPTARR
jgi:CSLREA domain-containing protein